MEPLDREMERALRKLTQKSAEKHIPRGKIPQVFTNFPTEAAKLAAERDNIRKVSPGSPRILALNAEIRTLVGQHRQDKWKEYLSTCDMRQCSKTLWHTIKELNGSAVQYTSQTFENPVCRPIKFADRFNKMCYPSKSVCKHTDNRNMMRSMFRKRSDLTFRRFAVQEAIRKTKKSKALGPDEIAPIMLKNMGELALAYTVVNVSL